MNRHRFGLACIALLGALATPPACFGGVSLDSRPHGVRVQIEGPLSWSGKTPLLLDSWPEGDYVLRVERLGLATARGRVRCTGNDQLTASRWTGPNALLLPPGLAQLRGDESLHGALFLGAGVLAGAQVAFRESDRRGARDDVDRASLAYEDAVSEKEIASSRATLLGASERASDARQLRTLWTGYLASVWAGAALDAWLLAPRPTLEADGEGKYVLGVPRAGSWSAGWRSSLVPGSRPGRASSRTPCS